jgi:hypothetical protein
MTRDGKESKSKDLSKSELFTHFYDSYTLNVSEVCVFCVSDVEQWREVPNIYILPPFHLDLLLKVRHVPVLSVPNIMYVLSRPLSPVSFAVDPSTLPSFSTLPPPFLRDSLMTVGWEETFRTSRWWLVLTKYGTS